MFGFFSFAANDVHFVFRALLGVDLFDANLIGKITNFAFAIAGYQHHSIEMMFRRQMIDKRRAFTSRLIAETIGRGILIVHQNNALQAACQRWQLID